MRSTVLFTLILSLPFPREVPEPVRDNSDPASISFEIKSIPNSEDDMARLNLLKAEETAALLFEAVEKGGLIVPGKSEEVLNQEVTQMALNKFGVRKHWHKKIVRSGEHTMSMYGDNPPDRIIRKDDMVFIDFGVIVDGWESDFARTYVMGNDSKKMKLKNDVEKAWNETQAWYKKQTRLKSSDFYQFIIAKTKEYGYTYGGDIAGHIVGKYPHEQPPDPKSHDLDIHPDSSVDLFAPDAKGNRRHWILEMHFVDKSSGMGAYMEKLL